MKSLSFFLGLIGGVLGLLFAILAAIAKSFSLWWLGAVFAILAIILSIMIFKRASRWMGLALLVIGIIGWIVVSKIFYIPAIILILAGLSASIIDPAKIRQ